MEKRKLISLRAVLLGYLVQTAVSCIVAAVLWFLLFFCASTADGFFRPTGRRGSRTRQYRTSCRTGQRKHLTRLSWTRCAGMCCLMQRGIRCLPPTWTVPICKKAMREWAGNLRWEIGYEQYYLRARLQDGTVCLLQFDYAVPYADPTLRDILPDVQTMHLILGIFLLVGGGRVEHPPFRCVSETGDGSADEGVPGGGRKKGHRGQRLYRGKGAGVR